jgi:hypothetical protein
LTPGLLESVEYAEGTRNVGAELNGLTIRAAIEEVSRICGLWRVAFKIDEVPDVNDNIASVIADQLVAIHDTAEAINTDSRNIDKVLTSSTILIVIHMQVDFSVNVLERLRGHHVECQFLESWIKRKEEEVRLWNDSGNAIEILLKQLGKKLKERNDIKNTLGWSSIANEVRERKSLWLTAAQELRSKGIPGMNAYNVSATDVFVEKAKMEITRRAVTYQWWGTIVASIAVITMIGLCIWLLLSMDGILQPHLFDYKPRHFTVILVKLLGVGAIIGSIAYFLISLSRALLHEGTALFARRHALRFGRLYVYLRGGNVNSVEELEKAFRWNDTVHTAFKDISADKASRSLTRVIQDAGIEAIRAVGSKSEKIKDRIRD